MLAHGLMSIAYDREHSLQVTEMGRAVLLGQKKVSFVSPQTLKARQSDVVAARAAELDSADVQLFESLRDLRRSIAQQKNIPPYIVCNDSTLEMIASSKPTSERAMKAIPGIADKKWQMYGEQFVKVILEHMRTSTVNDVAPHELTYALYKSGKALATIARERDIELKDVYAHLRQCIEEGRPVNLTDFFPKKEYTKIQNTIRANKLSEEEVYKTFSSIEKEKLSLLVASL
jgi:ATP-dependent DNA helicase RecQ